MSAQHSGSPFDDGAAYERSMGTWSYVAGDLFLDWLRPNAGMRWIDIGCGTGVFSELIARRCAPSSIVGLDSSEAQLAFAGQRLPTDLARFQPGDAQALPFADCEFDAAVMALVLFFIPDPAKAVAEMARVVRPGGVVAAYVWDITAGGSPSAPVGEAVRKLGWSMPDMLRSVQASRIDTLRDLWTGAGLINVETHGFAVERSFSNFDEYWTTVAGTPAIRALIQSWPEADIQRLRDLLGQRLGGSVQGRFTHAAHANAITGRVPA